MSDWKYDESHDPLNYHSFIYRITLPDGRFYLGKKSVWTMRAGKIHRESPWRTYWGSGKEIQDLVEFHGHWRCRREILMFCVSAGEASWQEMLALVGGLTPAVLDPRCLNKNVLMTFQRKVLEGYLDDGRRERYLRDIRKGRRAAGLIPEE